MAHRAVTPALGLALAVSALAGCTYSDLPTRSDPPPPGAGSVLCWPAAKFGRVVAEQDTTVGDVRHWQGYGGIANHPIGWIRHFNTASDPSQAAAWCWVKTGPQRYSVYLGGPAGTVRLVGTFDGITATPSGTPTWD